MTLRARDGLGISGAVRIDTFRAGMVALAEPYVNELRFLKSRARTALIEDRIRYLKRRIEDISAGMFIRTAAQMHNLVMDSPGFGLDLIIQRLTGNNTYSLNISWIEIGTGTTTPTVNDTALAAPSLRLPVSFQEDYGATDAILQAYVADANIPNATYGEVGSFVDGTSAIGSGQLFNHALIVPTFTKVSGQDVTIQIDFNIVNS